MLKFIAFTFVFLVLFLCSCRNNEAQSSDAQTEDTLRTITEDMAYEGVDNYCHSAYDWSVAKDNRRQTEGHPSKLEVGRGAKEEDEVNPDIMYLTMGEETDSTYQVVFRSYTGAFVHFYVNKTSGTTRMVEKVPSLNVEEEAGTIELFDYLEKQNQTGYETEETENRLEISASNSAIVYSSLITGIFASFHARMPPLRFTHL